MNIEVKISVKPIDYIESMEILEQRASDVFNGKKVEFLWILEHKPVYTAGTSAKNEDLLNKKIKVIKSKRGGKHTYHGPGQKVVYFVLNLNKRGKDIRKLVKKVENCIIKILKEYKIESHKDHKNIGIWVGDKNNSKKIAAIGIRVNKWVAFHGFSLNMNNDLSKYKSIIPCGIKNKGVTNLNNLGIINYEKIDKIIIEKFLNIFA